MPLTRPQCPRALATAAPRAFADKVCPPSPAPALRCRRRLISSRVTAKSCFALTHALFVCAAAEAAAYGPRSRLCGARWCGGACTPSPRRLRPPPPSYSGGLGCAGLTLSLCDRACCLWRLQGGVQLTRARGTAVSFLARSRRALPIPPGRSFSPASPRFSAVTDCVLLQAGQPGVCDELSLTRRPRTALTLSRHGPPARPAAAPAAGAHCRPHGRAVHGLLLHRPFTSPSAPQPGLALTPSYSQSGSNVRLKCPSHSQSLEPLCL